MGAASPRPCEKPHPRPECRSLDSALSRGRTGRDVPILPATACAPASPKNAGNWRSPLRVRRTARESRSRLTQPRSVSASSKAAPSAPPRCGRRSLQSRQGRRSGDGGGAPQPRPRRSARARLRPAGSARSPAVGRQPLARQHRVVHAHRQGAGHVVVAGARLAQRRWRAGLERRALGAGHHQQGLQRARHFAIGQPVIAMLALRRLFDQPWSRRRWKWLLAVDAPISAPRPARWRWRARPSRSRHSMRARAGSAMAPATEESWLSAKSESIFRL